MVFCHGCVLLSECMTPTVLIPSSTEVYLQATFKPLVNISPDARYEEPAVIIL